MSYALYSFQSVIPGSPVRCVFQENIIYNRLSVREHLEMWGAFKGISPKNLKEAIHYYADNLQLTHMLDNYAGDLSGGQKRKLC